VTIDARRLARDFPHSPDARTLLEKRRRCFARTQRALCKAASLLSCDGCRATPRNRRVSCDSFGRRDGRTRSDSRCWPTALGGHDGTTGQRPLAEPPCRRSTSLRNVHARKHWIKRTLDGFERLRCALRSLINAFQAVTGFSPMAYFKRERLSGVRQALQRPHSPRIRRDRRRDRMGVLAHGDTSPPTTRDVRGVAVGNAAHLVEVRTGGTRGSHRSKPGERRRSDPSRPTRVRRKALSCFPTDWRRRKPASASAGP